MTQTNYQIKTLFYTTSVILIFWYLEWFGFYLFIICDKTKKYKDGDFNDNLALAFTRFLFTQKNPLFQEHIRVNIWTKV